MLNKYPLGNRIAPGISVYFHDGAFVRLVFLGITDNDAPKLNNSYWIGNGPAAIAAS